MSFIWISGSAGGHHLLLFQRRSKMPFYWVFLDPYAHAHTHKHTHLHHPFEIKDRQGNFPFSRVGGMSWQGQSSRALLETKGYLPLAAMACTLIAINNWCDWSVCKVCFILSWVFYKSNLITSKKARSEALLLFLASKICMDPFVRIPSSLYTQRQ